MKYPAIAIIEFSRIPAGIYAGDAMVKKAPITVLKSGTIHNGKYLVLIGGSVASVEEAVNEGLIRGGAAVLDSVFLPEVHPEVHAAILGVRQAIGAEAIGIIETNSVPAIVRAADKSLKGTEVNLVELRLADDLGGKGLAIFSGKIEEVESALELARGVADSLGSPLSEMLIPRLAAEMRNQIDVNTRFGISELAQLPGEEG